MRIVYPLIAFAVMLVVQTKFMCRIPESSKVYITSEQYQIVILVTLLMLFNDPFYIIAILSPSLGSFIMNQFFISIFISFMLIFWLRINCKLLLIPANEADSNAPELADERQRGNATVKFLKS